MSGTQAKINHNVLWIFVDGVRRYHSLPEHIAAGDDRGRFDFMDEFAGESVEFLNTVTSAPSTFQSLSAMASGINSYYINRNFDDFIFDNRQFPSITKILKQNGYHCYCFLMHRETRVILGNLFPMIERKYWPKGFSHQKWWSNEKINIAIENTLKIGVDKPSFFFVDFNCRQDPDISSKIKKAVSQFRNAGYNEDNTIIILCSDHGYPDPSKETGNPEFYKKSGMSHDLVLTDDNIMIPLLIQYPGCPRGQKIDTTVSSIDIFPTILDLLNLPAPTKIHGKSLRGLVDEDIEYTNMMRLRFHRSDSRLAFQNGRGVSFRNGNFKYIYYYDNSRGKQEEFFDIINDPSEEKNLVTCEDEKIKNSLALFRKIFKDNENDAMNSQLDYLFNKFVSRHETIVREAKEILITDSCNPLFLDMIIKMIRQINTSAQISVLFVEHDVKNITQSIKPLVAPVKSWAQLDKKTLKKIIAGRKFDILFSPYNNSEKRDNRVFKRVVAQIKARNKVFLDYNMESFKKAIQFYWKRLQAAWPFIKYEPSFFITCCLRFVSHRYSLLIKKIRKID